MHEHDAHQPRPSSAGSAGTTQRALAAADALGINHDDLLGLLEGTLPAADFTRVMGRISTHAELSAWVIAAKQDRVALRQLGAVAAPAALSAALRDLLPASGSTKNAAADAHAALRLVGAEASAPSTGLRQWNREEVVPLLSRVPRVSRKVWSQARLALAAGLGIAACVGLYAAGTTLRDRFSTDTPGTPGIAGTQDSSTDNPAGHSDTLGTLAADSTREGTLHSTQPDGTGDGSRLAIADRAGSQPDRVSVLAAEGQTASRSASATDHAANHAASHAAIAMSSSANARPLITAFTPPGQSFGASGSPLTNPKGGPSSLAHLLTDESLAAALDLARDGRLIVRVSPAPSADQAAAARAALAPLTRARETARPWKLSNNTADSLAWLAAPVAPTAADRAAARTFRPAITGVIGGPLGSPAVPAAAVQLVMEENARRLLDAAAAIALPATVSINLNDAAPAVGTRQRPLGNVLSLDVQPTDAALRAALRALASANAGELSLEVLDRPAAARSVRSLLWWDAAPTEWAPRLNIPVVIGPTPAE